MHVDKLLLCFEILLNGILKPDGVSVYICKLTEADHCPRWWSIMLCRKLWWSRLSSSLFLSLKLRSHSLILFDVPVGISLLLFDDTAPVCSCLMYMGSVCSCLVPLGLACSALIIFLLPISVDLFWKNKVDKNSVQHMLMICDNWHWY